MANRGAAGDACALRRLGAPAVRVEFPLDTPPEEIAPAVARYAEAGTRVLLLAGFAEGGVPDPQAGHAVGSWAAAFGPGGTFWGDREDGALAVTHIELGNETAYATGSPGLGGEYARLAREAHAAIADSGRKVGLLLQADDGATGASRWVDDMVAAVPEIGRLAAGWTIHPSGPGWLRRIDRLSAQTARVGRRPIWVTEYGIASDNGPCLKPGNDGWDACISYSAAADALASAILGMRDETEGRVVAAFVFQGRDQRAHGLSDQQEHYFGALRHDGSRKGPYSDTVRKLWR